MFFCKQKTAYEVRISDWSSDVCSSDLAGRLLFCRGGCCRDQGCSRLCPYGRGACQTDRLDAQGRRAAGGRSDLQYRRFALSACRAGSTGRRRMNPIAFNDLAAQQARLRDRIDRAIAGVLAHGNSTLGPEVEELETQW